MQYIVLDLEWNQALSKDRVRRRGIVLSGEIIQIGAVRLSEDLQPADTLRLSVAPRYYKKMHWSVRRLTGISTESLENGMPFPEAYALFKEWCGENTAILTWGPDDMPMMETNLRLHGLDPQQLPPFYDLQKIYSRTVSGEKRQCALADALTALGITEVYPPHDALNDALNTAQICTRVPLEDAVAHYGEWIPLKIVREEEPAGERLEYASYDEMAKAHEKPVLPCPACGAAMVFGKWIRRSAGRRSTMADCGCGQSYVLKLRWHDAAGEPGGEIIAYRLMEKASSEQREAYQRALKRRRRRRK